MSMSEIAVAPTADLASVSAAERVADPFWPKAVVVLGLGLTAVWIGVLGYGIVKLIQLTI
jgi:hypothetical protein